jgi:hypothetical protein
MRNHFIKSDFVIHILITFVTFKSMLIFDYK